MTQLAAILLLHWMAPTAQADAPCSSAAGAAELSEALQRAESAFSALDVEAFTGSMDDAVFMVPCVREVLDAPTIARLHRLQGIRQFVANEEDRAAESFAAARAADPNYQLPVWLVPEGSAIRDLYGRVPLENGGREVEPPPVAGVLRFDGQVGGERPTSWSTLVQVVDGAGAVIETAYLYPGDAMPAYAAAPMPVTAVPATASVRPAPSRKLGLGLAGVSLGAAVGAGVVYGLASASARDFEAEHSDWDRADLIGAQSHTNNLVLASSALGVLAAGTGLGAAFVIRW